MNIERIRVKDWAPPRGYENGVLVEGSGLRQLHVAGQIAWDAEQRLVGGGDFVAQFGQALSNVVQVVAAAGGAGKHVVSMTIYVTDKKAYLKNTKEIGRMYRELMGNEYPAMALVQVADLLEDGALVEIQAVAILPGGEHP